MADWQKYYEVTNSKPPSPLLTRALSFCAHRERALDLGAGALSDSKFLLKKGFEVVAVDSSPLMLELTKILADQKLTTVQARFDEHAFSENYFDIINVQWALPFNPPATFDIVFEKIKKSLKLGGIFTGQFFGKKDEWNVPGKQMSFHDGGEIKNLLKDFDIIELQEKEYDGTTAVGQPKHWHVFHVIARKVA